MTALFFDYWSAVLQVLCTTILFEELVPDFVSHNCGDYILRGSCFHKHGKPTPSSWKMHHTYHGSYHAHTILYLLFTANLSNKFIACLPYNVHLHTEHNLLSNKLIACQLYHSVLHICPPSRISPPYIFSQSSCTGIFISRIGPPTTVILPK